MARSNAQKAAVQPANVKGAVRKHPRLSVVKSARPIANYEIVHGTVVLPDPDHEPTEAVPFRLAHYFPGEVIQLAGTDADMLLARGIIVEAGDEPVLFHTMEDRDRSYHDDYRPLPNGERARNPNPEPEGNAKLRKLDIDQAASKLYDADSSSSRLGWLDGTGRTGR